MVVFSSREDDTEKELKFLKLFSKQIELAMTIAGLFQTVKEQAVTDSMTGLYNRRYFEEFVQKEIVRSKRQNTKFSIIGIDLDHLKKINDKFGNSSKTLYFKTDKLSFFGIVQLPLLMHIPFRPQNIPHLIYIEPFPVFL